MSIDRLSRKGFIQNSSLSALGFAASFGALADAHEFIGDTGGLNVAQVQAAGIGLEIRLNANVIEDHFAAAPLDEPFYEAQAVAFRAGDGQPGLLYVRAAPLGGNASEVVAIVRNGASATGWSKIVRALDASDTFQNSTISPCLLVRGGRYPKVFAYGQRGLHIASLEGGFGQFAMGVEWGTQMVDGPRLPAPSTHGRLPDDAHYLLETHQGMANLRDIDTLKLILLGAGAADLGGMVPLPMTILPNTPKGQFNVLISTQQKIVFMAAYNYDSGALFNVEFQTVAESDGGNDILRAAAVTVNDGLIDIFYTMDQSDRASDGSMQFSSQLHHRSGRYVPEEPSLPVLGDVTTYAVAFPDKKPRICEVVCVAQNVHDGGFDAVLHSGGAHLGPQAPDRLSLCTVKPGEQTSHALPLADGVASVFTPSTQLEFIRSDLTQMSSNITGVIPREVWTIRNFSQFDVRSIAIPNTDPSKKMAVMRVGVTVYDKGLPQPGVNMDILADTGTWATVGGKERQLNSETAVRGTTDYSGRLTIAMPVGGNFYVPDLIVKSSRFTIKCHPSDYIVHRALTMSASDLLKHTDNPNDPSVQQSAQSAVVALANIRNTLPAVMPERTQAHGVLYRVITDGVIGAEAYDGPLVFPPPKIADPGALQDFTVQLQGGKLVATVAYPIEEASIFGSIGNFFEDVGSDVSQVATSGYRWVSHQASELGDTIVNGLTQLEALAIKGGIVLLGVVIDGAAYLFNGPLKGVVDALGLTSSIFWLLDKAGFALGKLTDWLLNLVFDFDAISRKRDQIKTGMRDSLLAATARIGDPVARMRRIAGGLDGIRKDVDGALASLQQHPHEADRSSSTLPTMPSFLSAMLGNEAVRAVVEKLCNAFDEFVPEQEAFSAGRFTEAGDAMIADMVRLAESFTFSLDDLYQSVESLLVDGDLFSAPLDPLLALLRREVNAGFLGSESVLIDSGKLLAIAVSNQGAVFDWLDAEIDMLPFVTGFYEGLFGGTLSPLDLMALAAAFVTTTEDTIRNLVGKAVDEAYVWPAEFCAHAASGSFELASTVAYTIESDVAVLPNIDNDATFALGVICAVTGALTVGMDCEYKTDLSNSNRLLLKIDAAANLGYLTAALATIVDAGVAEDLLFFQLWGVGVGLAAFWFNRESYSRSAFGAISAVITAFGFLKILYANTFSGNMSGRASAEMWGTGSMLIIEQVMQAAIRYYVKREQRSLSVQLTAGAIGTKLALAVGRNVVNRYG